MYGLFDNRQALIGLSAARPQVWEDPIVHKGRVMGELAQAKLSRFARIQPEARYLPQVIHPDEHIGGAVFGRCSLGLAMLVATDKRIIFLDKKPMFVTEDEINYDGVNGVTYGSAGLGATVTLHTRVKDYKLRTRSQVSASNFVAYIEPRCLEFSQRMASSGQTI